MTSFPSVLVSFVLVIGVLVTLAHGTGPEGAYGSAHNGKEYPYKKVRLPRDLQPLKYYLFLHPNVTHTLTYTGEVRILFNVKKETSDIILHSLNINHLSTSVYQVSDIVEAWEKVSYGAPVPVITTLKSRKLEQAMVRLGEKLSIGKTYVLVIYFAAPLRDGLSGFYKSSYVNPQKVTKHIATTDLEPTGARLAFPCFDEPSMKAHFSIVLVREPCCVALSNMPIDKSVQTSSGLVVDYFMESVRMSTYLVCFIVGEFASLSTHTSRGVKISVYVPEYQIKQAEYAKEVTPRILDYYERFFQVEFPLPKMDLIGIPDCPTGGMENWGLVTFRMRSLLYDTRDSSAAAKTYVTGTIAHELAHQWFGNLVTMKWWDDLWLNEGFATFVQGLGTDLIDHSWRILDEFPVNNIQQAMSIDSHIKTLPVKVPVKNPADIGALFGLSITYSKGSSLIRLIREFMGEKVFRKGLNKYLQKYKFSNAESDDLWACLGDVTPHPVKEIMNTWTLNTGYPVITIRREGNRAHFIQERFVTSSKNMTTERWSIPLTWYSQYDGNRRRAVFNKTAPFMNFDYPRGWLKLNADQYGFYRVNYDQQNWRNLVHQLKVDLNKLTAIDRSNLIDDAFALASGGRLSAALAFDLMEYFTKETEWAPVQSASNSLSFIDFILSGRAGHSLFQKYVIKQFSPLVAKLGFKDTGSYHTKLMRTTVLKMAVQHKHQASVNTAKRMFKNWMLTGKKIPVNVRAVVYYGAIRYGGRVEWDFLLNQYKNSKVATEKRTLMFALAASSDTTLLKEYLEMTLDSSIIKSQDTCYVIHKIAANPIGRQLAYRFLVKNWEVFHKRYTAAANFWDLVKLFSGIFGTGRTRDDLAQAKAFFALHPSAGGTVASDQAIADIVNHVAWLDRNEKVVTDWLLRKNVGE